MKLKLVGLLLFYAGFLHADKTIMVINCEGESKGASIYVNGKPKGSCPLELFQEEGPTTLKGVVHVDEEYERVFEKKIILYGGVIEEVDVVVGESRLSQAAIKKREIVKRQAEKQRADTALKNAKNGYVDAMREIANYYLNGIGIEQSDKNSRYWLSKVEEAEKKQEARRVLREANNGNIDAMKTIAGYYENGYGVQKSTKESKKWYQNARRAQQQKDERYAKQTLQSAEYGDVESMDTMARLYRDGVGVQANEREARRWSNKASKIRSDRYEAKRRAEAQRREEKRQAEMRKRKAEQAKRERYAREREIENLERQIQNIRYTKNADSYSDSVKEFRSSGPLPITSLVVGVVPTMTDIIMTPSKMMEEKELKEKIQKLRNANARAATWNNPHSMIARASH